MATKEEDYILRIWERAHEGLLQRDHTNNLINALRMVIRDVINAVRPAGGLNKSELLWVVLGSLWKQIMGDDQLLEARPEPGQCIAMDGFVHIDSMQQISSGQYFTPGAMITALMNAPPGKPVSFTSPKPEPQFPPLAMRGDTQGSTYRPPVPPLPMLGATQGSTYRPPVPPLPMLGATQGSTYRPPVTPRQLTAGLSPLPANTTPVNKGVTGPTMTMVDMTEQPPPPPAENSGRFSLQSLGNPFAAPMNCETWEIQLPREVSATEYVAPYTAIVGRMLHVWVHVPTGPGSKNTVAIKAHRSKNNDRHTNQAIYELECQFNIRTAYRIFTKWLQDMYRTGQAEDLIDFVQSEMKAICLELNSANQNAVNNCNRAIELQTPVKPPSKPSKDSHFYSPKPGSAAEKRTQEGEEEKAEGTEPDKNDKKHENPSSALEEILSRAPDNWGESSDSEAEDNFLSLELSDFPGSSKLRKRKQPAKVEDAKRRERRRSKSRQRPRGQLQVQTPHLMRKGVKTAKQLCNT
ncbi:hypothetical protein PG984_014731 [Apiospora sp. TS-2023a]